MLKFFFFLFGFPTVLAFFQGTVETVSGWQIFWQAITNIVIVLGTLGILNKYLRTAWKGLKLIEQKLPKIIKLADAFTNEAGETILPELIISMANDIATIKAQNEIIFEGSSTPVFIADEKGKCVYVNAAWSDITGLNPKQAQENGWQVALHFEDKEEVIEAWTDLVTNDHPFALEFRFVNQCNSAVSNVRARAFSIKNKQRIIIAFIGQLTVLQPQPPKTDAN